ncbi:replication protein RepA [Teichococcus vastitatis]|uniref:replication protein RepA n=1 Tax=Teichococcus vastitatis TaxID=2307076 RepID=UPI002795F0D1|nr:replication protein RepA [Pseudoroseomonas vastitatis]
MEHVGVPYGSVARLILLFLQTEALRTGSREIELGGSLRQWLSRLGASIGGSNARAVRDQAERISRCRLTFHIQGSGKVGLVNQSIVDRALFIDDEVTGRQGRLSLETAKLSEGFFEQLQKHPVPLEEAAIRAISNNPAALDAYLWLAYRLHVLSGDKLITWKALKAQFGAGYKELFHFKPRFTHALSLAAAVYPKAKIEVVDQGVILKPSPPPVPYKHAAIR